MDPTTKMLRFFDTDHLPVELADVSNRLRWLAIDMHSRVPTGPEKTAGMRKLLEAKDCFVRAALPDVPEHDGS